MDSHRSAATYRIMHWCKILLFFIVFYILTEDHISTEATLASPLNSNNIIIDFHTDSTKGKFNNFSEVDRDRLSLAARVLGEILNDEDDFQVHCSRNWDVEVNAIHTSIRSITKNNDIDQSREVRGLVFALFRLVYEWRVRSRKIGGDHFQTIILMFMGNSPTVSDAERTRSHMWAFNLQRDILSQDHESILSTLSNLQSSAKNTGDEITLKVELCNSSINRLRADVAENEVKVKNISQQLNFVSLANSFRQLIRERRYELRNMTKNLKTMGFFVVLPLLISVAITIYIWLTSDNTEAALKSKLLYSVPVLIPIEVILVYFFRIILREQISLKAQILQLELRYSVCAFIEGYVDFAKKAGDAKLEKFEALIFSGITPDPSAVPGTFDGMDQLLNLAKAAGGK